MSKFEVKYSAGDIFYIVTYLNLEKYLSGRWKKERSESLQSMRVFTIFFCDKICSITVEQNLSDIFYLEIWAMIFQRLHSFPQKSLPRKLQLIKNRCNKANPKFYYGNFGFYISGNKRGFQRIRTFLFDD